MIMMQNAFMNTNTAYVTIKSIYSSYKIVNWTSRTCKWIPNLYHDLGRRLCRYIHAQWWSWPQEAKHKKQLEASFINFKIFWYMYVLYMYVWCMKNMQAPSSTYRHWRHVRSVPPVESRVPLPRILSDRHVGHVLVMLTIIDKQWTLDDVQ